MNQNQKIAVAAAALVALGVTSLVFINPGTGSVVGVGKGSAIGSAVLQRPTVQYGSNGTVYVREQDMPKIGVSELDSPPVAPGASYTIEAVVPSMWSWGGHVVSVDNGTTFTVVSANIETRTDGQQWIVAVVRNDGAVSARFDGMMDYVAAPAIDAGVAD